MRTRQIFLLVLIYAALGAGIWAIFVGFPLWEGFVRYLVRIGRAIRESHVSIRGTSVLPLFPIFIALELVLSYIPLLFHRRDFTRRPKQQRISLLIPCHKSEGVIRATLLQALKTYTADEIYVLDNGNSPQPLDATRAICDELRVNYLWIPVGSKAAAIYLGANVAPTEFVMQIDDDQYVGDQVDFPLDEDTHCVGYTITAASHTDQATNLIQEFQDIEYKTSGITKSFEARLGTTQFAHGAMSLWRRSSLLACMAKHPAYPISDDWFLGFTASRLGFPITMCDSAFHSTDVPRSLFNLRKFDCGSREARKSGYGSATLWNQRFSRWYRLTILQFLYVLVSLFVDWRLPLRRNLVLKCSQCWSLLSILFTNLKFILIGVYFLVDPVLGGIFLALTTVMFFLRLLVLNLWQLRSGERIAWLPIFLFQVYKFYDNCVFGLGLLWSLFLTAPLALVSDRSQYASDPRLAEILAELRAGTAAV
jgi:cellulose synthase/poly-beta-1,6-N-acetylglucosamine synthase-like glycosyltransferase